MKTSYIVRAEKFLHEIYPYLVGKNDWYEVEEAVEEFNRDNHRKVKFAYGASRFALITSDYVIKYNRRGGAWAGTCEDENKKYQQAVKDGYAYLFAASTKVTYNYHNFYIMPRVYGIGSGKYWENLTDEELNYIFYITDDMHIKNYGHYHRKPVIIDYAMG